MKKTISIVPKSLLVLLFFMVVCGLYCLCVTGIAQLLFPVQANGSLIYQDGKVKGSTLIGQPFSNEKYLWGRAEIRTFETDSAGRLLKAGIPSNLSPYSSVYQQVISDREAFLRLTNKNVGMEIPLDLLTGSASGMDPDISVTAAKWQIPRISQASGLSESELEVIIDANTKDRFLDVFGEKRVMILQVNREIQARLDEAAQENGQ